MFRCIPYELAKIFSRRFLPLLWAGLLLLNGGLFFYAQSRREFAYWKDPAAARALAEEMTGSSLEEIQSAFAPDLEREEPMVLLSTLLPWADQPGVSEEIQRIVQETPWLQDYLDEETLHQVLDEIGQKRELLGQYQWLEEYPEYLDYVDSQAQTMATVSIFSRSGFSQSNARKTQADFANCRDVPLTVGNDRFVNAISDFRITDLLAVLLLLAATTILFLEEQENGLTRLLRSARNGGLATAFAKLAAVFLLAAAFTFSFYGENALLSGICYGLPEWGRTIQSLRSFRECTLLLNIGQYFLLFLGQKLAALVLCAFIFAVLTQLFRSGKLVYLGVLIFGGAEYLFNAFLHPASALNPLKYLNLFCLIDPAGMCMSYANLNFFGKAVGLAPVLFAVGGILAAVLAVGFCLLTLHPLQWTLSLPAWKGKKRLGRGSVSLTFQEFWRNFFSGKGVVVWLAAVLLAVGWYRSMPGIYWGYDAAVYRHYMERFSGELTPEKAAEIEKINVDFQTLGQQREELAKAYREGTITEDKYRAGISDLRMAEAQQPYFQAFYRQYQDAQMVEAMGKKGYLLDRDATDFLFQNSRRDWVTFGVTALLILLAVLPLGGSPKSAALFRATMKGRGPLFLRRMGFTCLAALLLTAGRWLPLCVQFRTEYSFAAWEAPIQNIQQYMGVSTEMTIGGCVALWAGMQLLAGLVYGAWFFAFTQLSANSSVRAISCLLLLVGTVGVQLAGVGFLSRVNPAAVFWPPTSEFLSFWPVQMAALLVELAAAWAVGGRKNR